MAKLDDKSKYEKTLNQLKVGEKASISKIDCNTRLMRRLFELGLLINERVQILAVSPLKNTYLIGVKNYTLALRKKILQNVFVEMIWKE